MPTAASIAQVREFNRKALELNALARRPDVADERRRMLGHEPPRPLRSATEAEIMAIAAQLDAGGMINPRLWLEHFAVSAAAQKAAA